MSEHLNNLTDEFIGCLKSGFKDAKKAEWGSTNCAISKDINQHFVNNVEEGITKLTRQFKNLKDIRVKTFAYKMSANEKESSMMPNDSFNFNSSHVNTLSANLYSPPLGGNHANFTEKNLLSACACHKLLWCLNSIAVGSKRPNLDILLPMAILCEGPEIIVISKQDSVASENSNKIWLKQTKIRANGFFHMKHDDDMLSSCKFINNIKSNHQARYSNYFLTNTAKYKLQETEKSGDCEAIITTNKVRSVLEVDNLSVQNIQLLVTPHVDHESSIAYNLHQELTILKGYIEYFSSGKIQWHTITPTDEDAQSGNVLDELGEMFWSLSSRFVHSSSVESKEHSSDDNLKMLFTRKEFDFTEKAWKVLQTCSSIKELISCWKVIFGKLESKSETSQYWLHQNNKTKLAELVRASYQDGAITFPSLESDQPIELLVEIGLEKLTNDYVHYFKQQRLATESKLIPYIDKNKSFESRLKDLSKLHYATELSLFCEKYFKLKHNQMYFKIQKFLESEETTKTTVFDVDFELVEDKINGIQPYSWSVSLLSNHKGAEMETVWSFTHDDPFALFRAHVANGDVELNDSDFAFDQVTEEPQFDSTKYYVTRGMTLLV